MPDKPSFERLERWSIERLSPYAQNARMHDDDQISQLASSIKRFGFFNPVLIKPDGGIVAGHGRVLGARRAGLTEVPVIVLHGMSETQYRALALADNRIALNASWDDDLLRSELAAIRDDGEMIDNLGFAQDELEALFEQGDALGVHEIPTDFVDDKFWISMRGPLRDQAITLQKLRTLLEDYPEVEIEIGTIGMDL